MDYRVGRKCEKGHGHEAGMVAPTTNVLKFTFTSLMLQYFYTYVDSDGSKCMPVLTDNNYSAKKRNKHTESNSC